VPTAIITGVSGQDGAYLAELLLSKAIRYNDHAEDFVVGTGETHSDREFCEKAFSYLGMDVHATCSRILAFSAQPRSTCLLQTQPGDFSYLVGHLK